MNTQEILAHARSLDKEGRQAFRGELMAITSIIGGGSQQRKPWLPRHNPNAIRPAGSTTPTGPRLGVGLTPLPDEMFADADVEKALKNGPVVWVYVLASVGLYVLAQTLQMPVLKVGASTVGFRDRLDALGRDQYGSRWKRAGVLQPEAHGHDRFEAEHPQMTDVRAPSSPVRQAARALEVRTGGMSGQDYEKALAAELRPVALHVWIQSDEGRAHCQRLGIDPQEMVRFTSYGFGPERRVSAATELFIFRPRLDTDRLADICERIVARYMGLI